MKKGIIFIATLILPLLTFAHEGNIAFFKIEQKETTVEVIAEFPWTIRNALLDFAPELKNSKSQEKFDTAFFDYIKSSFILTDIDGNDLELLSVVPVNSDGHSHQNDFLFTFKGSSYKKIINRISFNLNTNQINHHTIVNSYETKEYNTSLSQPNFEISKQNNANFGFLWLLILLPIGIALIVKKNLIH